MTISKHNFLKIEASKPSFFSRTYIDTNKAASFDNFYPEEREDIAMAIAQNLKRHSLEHETIFMSLLTIIGEKPTLLKDKPSQETKIVLGNNKEVTVTTIFDTLDVRENCKILKEGNRQYTSLLNCSRDDGTYTTAS